MGNKRTCRQASRAPHESALESITGPALTSPSSHVVPDPRNPTVHLGRKTTGVQKNLRSLDWDR